MSAAPTPYTRQNNFVADATSNPGITVSGIASDLDAEYEAIRTSVNQTISRLNEIQRPDGLLRSNVLDPAEYTAINAAVSSATNAGNSATSAATNAASASTSASTATTKAAQASTSATDALGYKNLAQTSATNAAGSATAAAGSETTATTQASNAATSATASAASAASASASASSASSSAANAASSAASILGSVTSASASATQAATSASDALASKNAAASSATAAQASATAAASSQALCSSYEVSAANSAAIATTKAHDANLSEAAAEAAKLTVLQAESVILPAANDANMRWQQFDARYLGAFAANPTTDNDGGALVVGATFFNTGVNELRVWNGTAWMAQYINANNTVSSFNSRQGIVTLQASDVSGVATGGVSTILTSNLTASRALASDASGKVAVSAVTATELGYVSGVTSAIQTQLNGKQATITGGATTIVSSDLTVSRALTSDASGKVAVSTVTNTELGYVSGVTSAIQTQLNGKEATITAGTTAQYLRGDKTWQDFFTDVRAATLTGLSTATNAVIAATDTVLGALGKLQAQVSALQTSLSSKLSSVSFAVDAFTGNGTTTAFTLGAASTLNATIVHVDGVYRHKTEYSVSGTTLTFTAAPTNLAKIEVMRLQAS